MDMMDVGGAGGPRPARMQRLSRKAPRSLRPGIRVGRGARSFDRAPFYLDAWGVMVRSFGGYAATDGAAGANATSSARRLSVKPRFGTVEIRLARSGTCSAMASRRRRFWK